MMRVKWCNFAHYRMPIWVDLVGGVLALMRTPAGPGFKGNVIRQT